MYEIDFLPVESKSGPGSKSGDAIAIRFTVENEGREAIVVIDAGYSAVGEDIVDHIRAYYNSDQVDLVISTHPDADHLNGLAVVIEQLDVRELWVHQPRLHRNDVSDFSNLEALDNLLTVARRRGVAVAEPFEYKTNFGHQLVVLGPTMAYYEELLDQHLAEARAGATRSMATSIGAALSKAVSLAGSALDWVLSFLPEETLTDEGDTGPRNNSSTIVLLRVDGHHLLFTGDAGIQALERAADSYDEIFGSFADAPLELIQVPHHGSKHNVGPTILNRILGSPTAPHAGKTVTAVCSSAKASKKHPAARVVNAFSRRGCDVVATEGKTICAPHLVPTRPGWGPIPPIPPLDESADDDT